ncbi:ESX secretion-associated protein EspG [Amycolatopsis acidiphila]|uniref:ESX secretion-associated protein EspG n=1 Tax=Amycolatopsis acidiphila TaxID=715473 RepID=A0A558AMQ5_9PSEU|nr:ESX secretion-associated protein EspG [Amycolatopsis acidiphila]TVT25553.1 ESX secretion-associated protein EspG [Amycolatopsis acidiphila]UIJ60301.1 ESX secretion-associated protein EspG [Amycolatopsis acidiphila]GHG60212.1 ESX secretion-associated protein EspG [Amycolatopsis acidiphila]
MPHQFSLSLAALDVLLEHMKLGRAPAPFEVPYIGTSSTQRAQVRGAVFRELESRGLAGRGRLDPDLELALHTFTKAPVAITAVAQLEEGKQLFARAVSNGQYAVVAKQDQNSVIFTDARPTAIVPGIVDLLPLTPAAAGQSVTVSKPAKRAKHRLDDDNSYDPFANVSKPRSTAPAQLRMVERIFQKPKLRIGQFSAVVQAHRLTPTAWFDTEEGRYFVTSRDAEDGQSWVTYAPADNARIAHHLFEQLQPYQ